MTLQAADIVLIEDAPFFTRDFPPLPQNALVRFQKPPRRRGSHLHRGYIASWWVREGRLHLTAVDEGASLFARGPVSAHWVTMTLTLPLGQRRRDLGHPYEPVHEADLELRVKDGCLTAWRIVHNPCRRRPRSRPGFIWTSIRTKLSDESLLPDANQRPSLS